MSIPVHTPSRLYSRDLCEIFEVSRMQLCRWIRDGKVLQPTGTIGNAFFWSRESFEPWFCDAGIDLVDTTGKTLLPDPGDNPELQALVHDAERMAELAEQFLVQSKQFEQKLRLDLYLHKRELSLMDNEEKHTDGESWKG